MKNYYLFFFLLVTLTIKGQTNCEDANSYLVSAYSHVKDAYDSNNISHLKYYSSRSIESFKLSKKTLSSCDCQTALDLADKGIELLAKVEKVKTFEDGRFYVKRAREVSQESVIEIDKCSVESYTIETNELTELQNEQLILKQQQEALSRKEQEIKTKLAEQKEKELILKKKELIISYEAVLALNIKTYNETLEVCNCNHEIIKTVNNSSDLIVENIENIKTHYNISLKTLTSNYLSQLEICDN